MSFLLRSPSVTATTTTIIAIRVQPSTACANTNWTLTASLSPGWASSASPARSSLPTATWAKNAPSNSLDGIIRLIHARSRAASFLLLNGLECLASCGDGGLHFSVAVGSAQEGGFELRWREPDALIEHGVVEAAKGGRV